MVNSMTGYGMSKEEIDGMTVQVEVKTINHRYLDISFRSAMSLMKLEEEIKKFVNSKINRGKIEIYINVANKKEMNHIVKPNWDLIDQYIKVGKELKEKYQLDGAYDLKDLQQLEGALEVEEVQIEDSNNSFIMSVVKNAFEDCLKMRQAEGKSLLTDLSKRIEIIKQNVDSLEALRMLVREEYQVRIQQRIKEYLKETDYVDEAKFRQDVVTLAEKGDITEEIIRLKSHISQFSDTINQKDGAIGRKLDFIIQEMHRETNTIGAKSTDSKISVEVVNMKSEIEKVKEQVQNIE
ncbi:YicC/YloC family endoribonuclease [Saliterribacillus persicus]|uniref:Uncharacterized protein (TIGR00255 family) n=1 Tax=Saliterribacillus persicus TaxID=930114 RepID=A0A368XRU1_9BACI|nr:YicC/YloC family endoribonuclease [Saliterribacillus persicus]RCW70770.1 uncharacterized protein (TIGR00255 family) [Saliterribacillus persicus]